MLIHVTNIKRLQQQLIFKRSSLFRITNVYVYDDAGYKQVFMSSRRVYDGQEVTAKLQKEVFSGY
jgi:hypothetical protein